jgi:hypothetical protein
MKGIHYKARGTERKFGLLQRISCLVRIVLRNQWFHALILQELRKHNKT